MEETEETHTAKGTGRSSGGFRERRHLHATIEVSMDKECPMYDLSESVAETRVFFSPTGECQCDIIHEAECDPVHVSRPIDGSCACSVFSKHGCVPNIESADGDRAHVSTYLPNRAVLSDLISELRTGSRNASLLRIVDCGRDGDERGITFDLTDLTETQRDTLELAVTEGYYEDPTGISLAELAEELNISKSGVSRRLSSIEAKILTNIVSDTL